MSRWVVTVSAWVLAAGFGLSGCFPFFNADGYGHLAQGRQIATLGRVPHVDLFSFWRAEPQPWSNYEWGYDLASWWLYDAWGASGLVIVKCLVLAILGWALVRLAVRLAGGNQLAAPIVVGVAALALPIARTRLTVRPQVAGLVFAGLLLLGIGTLYDNRSGRRAKSITLVGILAMQVVWVNAHGSHLLGLAIGMLFLAFSWRTTAFAWMLALVFGQTLAMGCTPFGFAIVGDSIAHLTDPAFRGAVTEWAPWRATDPLRLLVGPTAFAILTLVTLRRVTQYGRFGLAYGSLCVLLCAMAFTSTRFVAHQVLLCSPFIAAGLSAMHTLKSRPAGVAALVAAAAVVSLIWTARLEPRFGFGLGESRADAPWGSAAIIDEHLDDARVLATIQDSWQMMFATPNAKFLVDGRVPFYAPAFVSRVTGSFADGGAFSELLREFDVTAVVIDHTRADHIAATEWLSRDPGWSLVHVEDGHSLFVRDDARGPLPPLEVIAPGYRTGAILDPTQAEETITAEVARVIKDDDTGPMGAWLRGLQHLRPLARNGDRAGLRAATTPDETEHARKAHELLTEAAAAYPGFTSIEVYRTLAAVASCELENAAEALQRAEVAGPTRDTILAGLELSLRRATDASRAREHLTRLQSQAATANDPWVIALAADPSPPCRP
ncbi:MAG: hypothetical protein AAF436_05275 [Myxococcota bacterium]